MHRYRQGQLILREREATNTKIAPGSINTVNEDKIHKERKDISPSREGKVYFQIDTHTLTASQLVMAAGLYVLRLF